MFRRMKNLLDQGNGFGMVFQPNAPLPSADAMRYAPMSTAEPDPPEPKLQLRLVELLQGALVKAEPQGEELKNRQAALVEELVPLLTDLDKFLSDCDEEAQSILEKEHGEIRVQGRKQEQFVEKAENEFREVDRQWREATAARSLRRGQLEQAKMEYSLLSQWATDQEVGAAADAVARAESALERAMERETRAMAHRNSTEEIWLKGKKELYELANREQLLRARLEGRPATDWETGLEIRP